MAPPRYDRFPVPAPWLSRRLAAGALLCRLAVFGFWSWVGRRSPPGPVLFLFRPLAASAPALPVPPPFPASARGWPVVLLCRCRACAGLRPRLSRRACGRPPPGASRRLSSAPARHRTRAAARTPRR